jgi:hypothetical protein
MQDNPEFGDLPGLLRFEEPAPPSTPHRDTRLLTIFRVGKLITDRFEELCLVRNVGVGGVMVHVNSPLIVRQRVQIELRSDRKFWGNILWIKEGTAGIAFDRQMDIEDILRRGEITSAVHPDRASISTAAPNCGWGADIMVCVCTTLARAGSASPSASHSRED